MTTLINFDEIPTDNNGKHYYSQCDTFWRKEIDYQYKIQLQKNGIQKKSLSTPLWRSHYII